MSPEGSERWLRRGPALIDHITRLEIPKGSIGLWYLGLASFAMKTPHHIFYFDPYFRNPIDEKGRSIRQYPPPFAGGDIRHADFVLCSHPHLDHLDPVTLEPLAMASPQATFIVPAPAVMRCENMGIQPERILAARTDQPIQFENYVITPLAVAHVEFETDENDDHINLSYVVDTGQLVLYHAGDTVDFPHFAETLKSFPIDIALLPINGNDRHRRAAGIFGNLDFREAVDLAVDSGVKLLIPMHYDLLPNNQTNPAYLIDYLYHTYPWMPFRMLALGECLLQDTSTLVQRFGESE